MRKLVFVFMFGLATAYGSVAFAAEEPILEGKTFDGEFAPKGEKKGSPDKVEFKGGIFYSSLCQEVGYSPLHRKGQRR